MLSFVLLLGFVAVGLGACCCTGVVAVGETVLGTAVGEVVAVGSAVAVGLGDVVGVGLGLTSADTGAGLSPPLVSAAAVALPPAITTTLPMIAHV
ncbi:hypothetical protein [Kitasatospora sp. NPDC005856]|uniref:hypothetical protein n=1 Tax=Kitasatospora sp. NPDC005856 TaxID=3154566 RepID=UPI0033F4DFF9